MSDWMGFVASLLGGLVVLGVGGEMLVGGAGRLARIMGVSALVVGLTVVAFGTSAPEAAVTVFAALQNSPDIAIGNVVGSNIANILLILGFAATLSPMIVSRQLLRVDGPIMVVTACALAALAFAFAEIPRWSGLVFLAGLVGYTWFTYQKARKTPDVVPDDVPALVGFGARWWYNVLLVLIGIGGLVLGARFIVYGASGLATLLGISETIIGLTIVAIGTSLPELATTISAARQKQVDIAVGNVVGSNIFNVLFVLGLAATTAPLPVSREVIYFDTPIMLGVCIAFVPLVWTGQRLTRGEGMGLLAAYVLYLSWAGVRATQQATAG